jgi:hypothetical protein
MAMANLGIAMVTSIAEKLEEANNLLLYDNK